MGNSQKDSGETREICLRNVEVLAQVTTIYGTAESLVEALAWNKALLTLEDKTLTLVVYSDKQENYEMQVDGGMTIVKEVLSERKVGLRYVKRQVLTLVQVQFPTTQSFLMWFLCFNKAKRPLWDPQTTVKCKVTSTQVCSNKFSWLRRQHHCRNCGQAVCNPCSRHREAIHGMGYPQPQRICSPCTRVLHPDRKPRPRSQKLTRNRAAAASVSYITTPFQLEGLFNKSCRFQTPPKHLP